LKRQSLQVIRASWNGKHYRSDLIQLTWLGILVQKLGIVFFICFQLSKSIFGLLVDVHKRINILRYYSTCPHYLGVKDIMSKCVINVLYIVGGQKTPFVDLGGL